MELQCCLQCAEGSNNGFNLEVFYWLGTLLLGFGGYFIAYKQFKMSLNSSKEEREINSLSKKLNEFYGPFYQLRKKSFTLYKEFRKKFETEDPNFSTLKYLLSGKRFSGNDEVLLNEIILIGEECEDFIHKNAGLIDHNEIRNNLLPKLTTHYRLIKLAKDGMLKGDLDTIGRYTFPKEIDSELENRINEIKARLNELNKKI